jgi:hypothetical protein
VRATCHESHPSFKARLNTLRAKKMREIIKRYLPMACVVLMAIGQFLCALGSGHPDTLEPLSDWINNTANVINIVIGIMVFIPRARLNPLLRKSALHHWYKCFQNKIIIFFVIILQKNHSNNLIKAVIGNNIIAAIVILFVVSSMGLFV